eukprot:GFUD01086908.1.p1 GENE.GFUD01086908.1~~GFUD01086908.1.p1  ORF type:complete len:271 (+),score=113.33 GFUD01086908.1:134-946(+)
MSLHVSENVQLEQLTEQPQECYEDGQKEDEGEKEDLKEGREEEMSLLGEEDRLSCPPVQIITAARHTSGAALVVPTPLPHQPSAATPCPGDPDIQLARTEPGCGWPVPGSVQAVPRPGGQLSSIHSVCGPKQAKVTIICLLALSIWTMVVLIMHLDKKVSVVNSSLSYTEDKLRTMEDTASSYRLATDRRLHKMQNKLGQILRAVKTGTKPRASLSANLPGAVQPSVRPATPSQYLGPPGVTEHGTEQETGTVETGTEEAEDFFDDDWSF